jgi:hypothetical protein
MHKLDKTLPENSKYYGHWGYTIYRTHYSLESDEQWNTLLDALKRQTRLAVGYYQDEPFEDELMHQRADFLPKAWYYESQNNIRTMSNGSKTYFILIFEKTHHSTAWGPRDPPSVPS